VPKKGSRKVLHIPLDTLAPVDAEVYNILHEFKSSIECKNYLMNAVLYYARSPLVTAMNALMESLGQIRFLDSFSGVHEKLDTILLEVRSIKAIPMAAPAEGGVEGLEGGKSSGLDSGTKTTLNLLKQKFKI
jgi:hypothetical protein